MILLFYIFVAAGLALAVEDVRGHLTASPERAGARKIIGVVSAASAGLAPIALWQTGWLQVSWPYPIVALASAAFFLIFAIGVSGVAGAAYSPPLRRAGYIGLLAVAAVPSSGLVLLAPLVAIAGMALTRPTESAVAR
jgi:hypothetical protein